MGQWTPAVSPRTLSLPHICTQPGSLNNAVANGSSDVGVAAADGLQHPPSCFFHRLVRSSRRNGFDQNKSQALAFAKETAPTTPTILALAPLSRADISTFVD